MLRHINAQRSPLVRASHVKCDELEAKALFHWHLVPKSYQHGEVRASRVESRSSKGATGALMIIAHGRVAE